MIKYLILQTRDTTEHEHNKIVMDIVNTLDVYQGVKIDALIRYTKIMSYFILSYDLSLEQEIKAKLNDIITVRYKNAKLSEITYYDEGTKPQPVKEYEANLIKNSIMN